jgi:type I restriction enzyme M protein
MAIAEDIGYDATGRNTNNNELIEIGKELSSLLLTLTRQRNNEQLYYFKEHSTKAEVFILQKSELEKRFDPLLCSRIIRT